MTVSVRTTELRSFGFVMLGKSGNRRGRSITNRRRRRRDCYINSQIGGCGGKQFWEVGGEEFHADVRGAFLRDFGEKVTGFDSD